MKTIKSAVIKSIIIIVAALVPAIAFPEEPGALRVTLVEGDAELYMQDGGPPFSLMNNMSVREKDRLWVPGGGKAEIYLRGGTYLRLGEGTSLTARRLEESSAGFYLDEGRLYVNGEGRGGGYLTVDTPLTSVEAGEGSVFMVDVSPSGSTGVSVLKGSVRARGRSADTAVKAGEALRIRDDRYAELSELGPRDDWEAWNADRDSRLPALAEGDRYLPEELHEYSPELAANGRWIYDGDYGYVWLPTVSITVGWVPYRNGRWVWVGDDYLWVSYEPWGWAPYHYGRWVHLPRAGWCWVPPRHRHAYWGPGFVAWVRTPDYVAWLPLAPGETYYGYRSYGPDTINIRNRTVLRSAYRNVYVNNAVTVVHNDTFFRGKKTNFRMRTNPFLEKNARFGPPARMQRRPESRIERRPERDDRRGRGATQDRRGGPGVRGPRSDAATGGNAGSVVREAQPVRPVRQEAGQGIVRSAQPARTSSDQPRDMKKEAAPVRQDALRSKAPAADRRGDKAVSVERTSRPVPDKITPRTRKAVPEEASQRKIEAPGNKNAQQRQDYRTSPKAGEGRGAVAGRGPERKSPSPAVGSPARKGSSGKAASTPDRRGQTKTVKEKERQDDKGAASHGNEKDQERPPDSRR